jgi:acetoin utilization protein AcuB
LSIVRHVAAKKRLFHLQISAEWQYNIANVTKEHTMLTVNDLMTVDPTTVKETDSLMTVIGRMKREGCRQLPVVDSSGKLVGMITDRDLRLAMNTPHVTKKAIDQIGMLKQVSADSIMTPDPVTTQPDVSAQIVATQLATYKFGALPVVEDGVLVGIISVTDYLEYFASLPES